MIDIFRLCSPLRYHVTVVVIVNTMIRIVGSNVNIVGVVVVVSCCHIYIQGLLRLWLFVLLLWIKWLVLPLLLIRLA